MWKHANERAWLEYDSWRTREPEDVEKLTLEERTDLQIDAEDYAREATQVQDEMGPRFRPARHVRLFDEM